MRGVSISIKLIIVCICALSCASCGPRMRIQPSIQPFEKQMPDMPKGVVPTSGRLQTFTLEQSKLAANPLPKTSTNLQNGRIYYGYYCLMCHGAKGDGNGPVGESYVPKPADLSAPAVTKLSDGELYKRMLTGIGHDPVMGQTVLPNQRWPIVMYVRKFAE